MQSNYIPFKEKLIHLMSAGLYLFIHMFHHVALFRYGNPLVEHFLVSAPGGVERGFDIVVSVFVIAVIGDLP